MVICAVWLFLQCRRFTFCESNLYRPNYLEIWKFVLYKVFHDLYIISTRTNQISLNIHFFPITFNLPKSENKSKRYSKYIPKKKALRNFNKYVTHVPVMTSVVYIRAAAGGMLLFGRPNVAPLSIVPLVWP